jgi:hypothetical protein
VLLVGFKIGGGWVCFAAVMISFLIALVSLRDIGVMTATAPDNGQASSDDAAIVAEVAAANGMAPTELSRAGAELREMKSLAKD